MEISLADARKLNGLADAGLTESDLYLIRNNIFIANKHYGPTEHGRVVVAKIEILLDLLNKAAVNG